MLSAEDDTQKYGYGTRVLFSEDDTQHMYIEPWADMLSTDMTEEGGKRGAVDRASDSKYMNDCPAWVRARMVPKLCVSFLCP